MAVAAGMGWLEGMEGLHTEDRGCGFTGLLPGSLGSPGLLAADADVTAGADHASATAGAPAIDAVNAVNVDAAHVTRDVVAVDAAVLLVATLFVDKGRHPLCSLCVGVGVALGVAVARGVTVEVVVDVSANVSADFLVLGGGTPAFTSGTTTCTLGRTTAGAAAVAGTVAGAAVAAVAGVFGAAAAFGAAGRTTAACDTR